MDSKALAGRSRANQATSSAASRPRPGRRSAAISRSACVSRRDLSAESATASASSNGRVVAQSITVRNGLVRQPSTSEGSSRCHLILATDWSPAPTLRPRGTTSPDDPEAP